MCVYRGLFSLAPPTTKLVGTLLIAINQNTATLLTVLPPVTEAMRQG